MWHFKIFIMLVIGSVVLGTLLSLFTNKQVFRRKTTGTLLQSGLVRAFLEMTAGISLGFYCVGTLVLRALRLINDDGFIVLGIGAILLASLLLIYEIFKKPEVFDERRRLKKLNKK